MSNLGLFVDTIQASLGSAPGADRLIPGKFVRFSLNGKRSDDSGWALLFEDGRGGVYGNWRTGFEGLWQEASAQTLTRAEKLARSREIEKAKRQRWADELAKHEAAATWANQIWKSATLAAHHAYATRKGVSGHGLRVQRGHMGGCSGAFYVTGENGSAERLKGDLLLIPMYGDDRRLWSLQAIDSEGRKSFLKGGRTRGLFHLVGSRLLRTVDQLTYTGEVAIAEGLATSATVHKLTGVPVFTAFNAGNLARVATAVRGRLPMARVTIAGDVDSSGVGQAKAEEAARTIGALVSFPPLTDAEIESGATDWNDYARLHPDGPAKARQA